MMKHYPDITLRDTMYEPGSYHCHCADCKEFFIGHKRSSTCLPCAEKWIAKYNSWTQEQRHEFREKQAKEIADFFENKYPKIIKR